MEPWQVAVILAAIAVGLWSIVPRPLFVVVLEQGEASLRMGKASRRFLDDCERICQDFGIEAGTIKGFVHAGSG